MTIHNRATLLAAACLAGLVTGACSKPDPTSPEFWVEQLTNKKTRDKALQDVRKERKDFQVPGLLALLKEEGQHRDDVVQVLGRIGEEHPELREKIAPSFAEVVDYGVGAAGDKTSRGKNLTNQRVAEAVGRMKWSGSEDVVIRLLDSRDNNTRLASVTALGNLQSKAAVDKLIQIADEDDNNFMVKNAIISLGKIADPKAVPVLVKSMFFERSVSFYREASYALFQVGRPSVGPLMDVVAGKGDYLKKLTAKPDPWIVKAKVVEVLADIADPKAAELAMSILKAPDSGEAFQKIAIAKAAAAAGRMGVKEAAPFLKKAAADIDVTQAELPLEALALIGDRASGQELLRVGSKDAFYSQCGGAGYDKESCSNSEIEVRQARLEAGTRLCTGADLPTMEKMEAAEKDAKVKDMVTKEKVRLVVAKECGDKVECWIGKLKDPDAKVREKAGWELNYLKKPEAAEPLLNALKEDNLEARFAIVMALMRNLPKSADAADRVRKILDDEDGKVQFIKINEDLKRLEVKLRRGY